MRMMISGSRRGERVRRRRDPPAAARPPRRARSARSPPPRTPGTRLGPLHPHLHPLADQVLLETTPETLAGHDVVFLALPHGASAALAAQLPDDVVVVDCGADFRLDRRPRPGTRFYGTDHAGTWPYGLPELPLPAAPTDALAGRPADRRARAATRRPAAWRSRPAVAAGLRRARRRRGRRRQRHLRRRQVAQAAPARRRGDGLHVAVRRGRHPPAHPRDRAEPRPAAGAPVTRLASPRRWRRCRAASWPPAPRRADRRRHAPRPSAPPGRRRTPTSRSCTCCPRASGRGPATSLGSNVVQVQVALDERTGRVVAVASVDNLTKGTAGAAVQCANLALGLPETTGLPIVGVAP